MRGQTSQAQTRIAVDDGTTMVVDVESAVSEVYDVLASERRRRVLSVLVEESTPVEVEGLAESVAARESEPATENRVERVHVSLYHHHLPKLAETGLIEYDSDRCVVEENTRQVEPVPG